MPPPALPPQVVFEHELYLPPPPGVSKANRDALQARIKFHILLTRCACMRAHARTRGPMLTGQQGRPAGPRQIPHPADQVHACGRVHVRTRGPMRAGQQGRPAGLRQIPYAAGQVPVLSCARVALMLAGALGTGDTQGVVDPATSHALPPWCLHLIRGSWVAYTPV